MRLAALIFAILLLTGPGGRPALAQPAQGTGASPILIIDQERLFGESRMGERMSAEIEETAATLAEQNRAIEAELIAEELALTERRAELSPEEFRTLAREFDGKVQRLRAEQDEKERDLSNRQEENRQAFLARIAPILGDLARERGAVAILDRRAVFLAAGSIDVTEAAITKLNEVMAQEGAFRGLSSPVDEDPDAVLPGSGVLDEPVPESAAD